MASLVRSSLKGVMEPQRGNIARHESTTLPFSRTQHFWFNRTTHSKRHSITHFYADDRTIKIGAAKAYRNKWFRGLPCQMSSEEDGSRHNNNKKANAPN